MTDNEKPNIPWEQLCSYEYFLTHRYIVPSFEVSGSKYEVICNNGFIKLYMPKMRVYWHVQNEFGHRLRDWKLHVSVSKEDVPQAWNLLSKMFINMRCRGCMKVCYLPQSKTVNGRQITIYIFKYEAEYEGSSIAQDFQLSLAEEHSDAFWLDWIDKIENLMKDNKIKSNGLAYGDFQLGQYVSLRNQSYIQHPGYHEHIYPPDDAGWNANDQEVPFDLKNFKKSKIKDNMIVVGIFLLILLM